ncbi:MAG: hypothetical protein FJ253_03005, partial [Phycisphaerae bacterium]|nr:hypothetical protein [Phycisphaerae bacterium]
MKATIEASAGTGKTYELTTIVAAALGGGGLFAPGQRGSGLVDGPELAALESARPLRASEIVLVTYTEAATRELRGRVRGRLAALRRQLVDRGAPDAGADPSLDDESRTRAAARLGAALSDIDSLTVSTIHGFCDRLVQEHAFELGHAGGRRELLDEPALAEELAMRWWSARVRDDAERLERCRVGGLTRSLMTQLALEAISSRGVECAEVRGDGAGGDAVAALALDLMAFSRRAVAALCDSRGATTYQDMVLSVRDALRERPRFVEQLRSRHRLGVIDEAQDTDPVQLEIFERIFHGAEATDRLLVLVGDPKQAIYGFRGADLDAYLRLRGTESPRRLDTNWRSEPGAVAATNRLFSLPEPFGRPGIEHPRVHARNPPQHGVLQAPGSSDASSTRAPSTRPAPLEIHVGAPGETPLDWCATTLKDLHARGLSIRRAESVRPVRWSDFAVLGRSNAALGALDERLRAEGVPTLLLGDRSVLESSAAGEVAALLAACAEPGRGSLVRRAMVSSIVGIEASALAGEQGESLVREWSGRFDAWGRAAPRGGALAIVERALAARTSPADPRTAVDALHLAELLHAERLASAGVREWLAMLDRLVSQTESSPTRPGDPRRRRIERDDAVTLRTQHTAKGLEFGIVLLPWADGSLASSSWHRGTVRVARLPAAIIAAAGAGIAAQARVASDESVIVPVTKDGALAAPLAARDAEEGRRLFYVAVTRARHATLLFSAPRTRSGEPSAIEAYRVVERADGHEIRVVAPKERGTAAGASADASAGASAGAGAERAAEAVSATAALPVRPRRALSRSLRLWIDTSFTSLSRGAEPGEV